MDYDALEKSVVACLNLNGASLCEFDRVLNQVDQNLLETSLISDKVRQVTKHFLLKFERIMRLTVRRLQVKPHGACKLNCLFGSLGLENLLYQLYDFVWVE